MGGRKRDLLDDYCCSLETKLSQGKNKEKGKTVKEKMIKEGITKLTRRKKGKVRGKKRGKEKDNVKKVNKNG